MRAATLVVLTLVASGGSGAAAAADARTGSLIQQAPAEFVRSKKNPFAGTVLAAEAGAKLYRRACASCHGRRAEGAGKAPPLNRSDIHNAAPGALFWVLRNGSPRLGMPSFAHVPEPQRWQIVTYLQSLHR
jgi:mono/diheme cytochrome c family protein